MGEAILSFLLVLINLSRGDGVRENASAAASLTRNPRKPGWNELGPPPADTGDAPAPLAEQRERERPGQSVTEAAAPKGRRPGPAPHRPRGGRQGRRGPRSAPRGGGRGCPERAAPPAGKEAEERGEPTPPGGLKGKARAAPGQGAEAREGTQAGPALPPASGRSCRARGSSAPEPAPDAAARGGEAVAPPGPAPPPLRLPPPLAELLPAGRPRPPAPVVANPPRLASERAW